MKNMAFDENKYKQEFLKENYDEIKLRIPKGNKQTLKQLAQLKNISVNQLITEAIENYYHIDISKK